jgi:hypothetical protein
MGSSNVTLYAVWIPKAFGYSRSASDITITSLDILTGGGLAIPGGTTAIAANVGAGNSYITSVSIPATVRTIGTAAFTGCSKLTGISVDSANLSWQSDAKGVLFSKDGTTILAAPGQLSGTYALPGTATAVLDKAFSGCTKLTGVTIPNGVTSIGFQSFSATGLFSVSLPASVMTLGQDAFSGAAIQSFFVESANSAFSSDSQKALYDKAQTLLIAVGVQSIANNTFTIPSTVKTIGSGAFSGYGILHSITIPTSVTTIGDYAFMSSGLTSVTIPASVSSIGSMAFYRSSNLVSVTLTRDPPPVLPAYSQAFGYTSGSFTIHVPTTAQSRYKAATGWSSYASSIVSP